VHAEPISIDSSVLGRTVLALQDPDPAVPFGPFEDDYVHVFDPGYVYCKVPMESIGTVHHMERQGFSLIETQIKFSVKLRKPYDLTPFGQYRYEPVATGADLAEVLEIAEATFVMDRWRVDPYLSPELAGRRYRAYVQNSFSDPGESVFRLVERRSGRTLAFRTHRCLAGGEVLFLLGGVHPDFKNIGLGLIAEHFEFNELMDRGFKHGITHISAANYAVFNLDLARPGFRVATTFAVLRKIYDAVGRPQR